VRWQERNGYKCAWPWKINTTGHWCKSERHSSSQSKICSGQSRCQPVMESSSAFVISLLVLCDCTEHHYVFRSEMVWVSSQVQSFEYTIRWYIMRAGKQELRISRLITKCINSSLRICIFYKLCWLFRKLDKLIF